MSAFGTTFRQTQQIYMSSYWTVLISIHISATHHNHAIHETFTKLREFFTFKNFQNLKLFKIILLLLNVKLYFVFDPHFRLCRRVVRWMSTDLSDENVASIFKFATYFALVPFVVESSNQKMEATYSKQRSECYPLHVCLLCGWFFEPEDWGDMSRRNVVNFRQTARRYIPEDRNLYDLSVTNNCLLT
jgi:hypothetical protein